MDFALIASECVDSKLKGNEPGVMCKLEILKASGHVNWKILLNILRQSALEIYAVRLDFASTLLGGETK